MRYTIDHNSVFYVHEAGRTNLNGSVLRKAAPLDDEWVFNCFFALGVSPSSWRKHVIKSGIFHKGLIHPDGPHRLKPYFIVMQNPYTDDSARTFAVTNSKMRVFAGDDVQVHRVKIPRQMSPQDSYEVTQAFEQWVKYNRP
ncbi:hypothetical protein [Streptomyces malaysiensis]|uniref:Uncharacterized protein n=1 Tax=Streptomyces malaysiensis TaxID=92644 RepID=A0A2J7Z8F9_STRMQ|nr:hypothetical protein [Streptomyces malaysiensis]PNG96564.1 hypothetical protein SMF913_12589 [Streptomyces malaysiensis]